MKKYLFLGLILILTGCQEANEIFGDEEYLYDEIIISEDGEDRYYPGPVYIDATSWGSIAYVSDKYVNKGIELLISETSDAEGGKVLEVNSNAIAINDLSANTQYHYCLYLPDAGIKSQIKQVVVPDVSALDMILSHVGDSVFCTIEDSISSSFIQEKGFRIYGYDEYKYIATGKKFAFSIPEFMKENGITDDYFSFHCYAYVQTSNAYYRSGEKDFQWEGSSSSDSETDEDTGSETDDRINREGVTISAITEETIDGVEYLKCTVKGYVDNAYFNCASVSDIDYQYYTLNPDSVVTNDEGTETTYYLKKGFYKYIRLKIFYRLYWNYENGRYDDYEMESSSYTPIEYNIRSLDDFLAFVSYEGSYSTPTVLHFLEDINLPSDLRLSLNWSNVTVNGNNHTIDGISYFPLFRTMSYVKLQNLKFGTDDTVYEVKKGTGSFSTTSAETPGFLLSESTCDSYYICNFDSCEIRGTIQVSGRDDFYVTKDYYYYWSESEQVAGTFEDHIVRIPGLKDYTKTEFK